MTDPGGDALRPRGFVIYQVDWFICGYCICHSTDREKEHKIDVKNHRIEKYIADHVLNTEHKIIPDKLVKSVRRHHNSLDTYESIVIHKAGNKTLTRDKGLIPDFELIK